MTQVGSVYGEALYDLAKEESITDSVLNEITALSQAFGQEPDFLRLLAAPSLSKDERCKIIDDSFRGKIHTYVLNFLKILTEKGYVCHFQDCCQAYRDLYNRDNGILPVQAISAVALSKEQTQKLTEKLSAVTGKQIYLIHRVDPDVLGGIRLDYDGKRLDDTVSHRLDAVRNLLKNTVL